MSAFQNVSVSKMLSYAGQGQPRSRRSASTVKKCALLKMLQLNTSLSSHAHVLKGNPKHVQTHIHVMPEILVFAGLHVHEVCG